MQRKLLILLVFSVFLFIFVKTLHAEEIDDDNFVLVSQVDKYYKTVTYYDRENTKTYNFNYYNKAQSSKTYEITKEEYENQNVLEPMTTTSIETTYKKLTSRILQNSNLFKYEAILNWKNFPKKRSYDIIGIGFNNNVAVLSSPAYYTEYCLTNGICQKMTSHSPKTFSNGVGTTFLLPTGDLTSLSTTFSVIITKNDSNTITNQIATADYSHATKSISLNNAKNYDVTSNGIVLNGIASYYDEIQPAIARWYGNW